jgi:hypothetical protein
MTEKCVPEYFLSLMLSCSDCVLPHRIFTQDSYTLQFSTINHMD